MCAVAWRFVNFVFCVATQYAVAYIKQLAGDCANRLLQRCLLFAENLPIRYYSRL